MRLHEAQQWLVDDEGNDFIFGIYDFISDTNDGVKALSVKSQHGILYQNRVTLFFRKFLIQHSKHIDEVTHFFNGFWMGSKKHLFVIENDGYLIVHTGKIL
jgi:hypothetical protein